MRFTGFPSRVDFRSDAERAAFESAIAAQAEREARRAARAAAQAVVDAWNARHAARCDHDDDPVVFLRSTPAFMRRQAT